MIGQKDAVVKAVKTLLPGFLPYRDIALVMLTKDQLEAIKMSIGNDILYSVIEYSKDRTNRAEVVSYARSMVMNHLKKCKELNGNQTYSTNPTPTTAKEKTVDKTIAGINMEILPEELQDFVKTLV